MGTRGCAFPQHLQSSRQEFCLGSHPFVSSIYDWVKSYVDFTPVPETQILTHVFAGSLAGSTAETNITITNRTQETCKASVWFHRGTEEALAVRFDEEYLDGNRMETDIEGGTVRSVLLTAEFGHAALTFVGAVNTV